MKKRGGKESHESQSENGGRHGSGEAQEDRFRCNYSVRCTEGSWLGTQEEMMAKVTVIRSELADCIGCMQVATEAGRQADRQGYISRQKQRQKQKQKQKRGKNCVT